MQRADPHGDRIGELGRNLNTVALHLVRAMRRIDDGLGVPPARLSALSALVFGGPGTIKELAIGEHVTSPTMTDVVAGLERSGFVTRDAHPTDGRSTVVSATAAGVEVIRRRQLAQVAYINDNLSHLTPDQLDVLVEAVDILSDGFSIKLLENVPAPSENGSDPSRGVRSAGARAQ